jgi:hypothetical protein
MHTGCLQHRLQLAHAAVDHQLGADDVHRLREREISEPGEPTISMRTFRLHADCSAVWQALRDRVAGMVYTTLHF